MALPFLAAGAAKLGASWLARKGVTTAAKKVLTKAAPKVLASLKTSGTAAKLARATGSSKILKSAAAAAKSITGISSLQKAAKLWKAGGLVSKAKALGYGALGAMGLKFTRDVVTGAVKPAAATPDIANDIFQATEGAGADYPTDAPPPVAVAPPWDAPDILPDFIEERLEDLSPAQLKALGYGGAAAAALGLAGGLYAKREEIMDVFGVGDGTTITAPAERRKAAKKKPSKTSKDPTFKILSKEWKKLSKGDKEYYEGKFSEYVKVQKDMRTKAGTKTTKKKTGKKTGKKTTQQNRMKAAAKKWKKYTGKLSYQDFMSKELQT